MKKLLTAVAGATLLLVGAHSAFAATVTFDAATYLSLAESAPTTVTNVDAGINATLNTTFGFTVANGYLYHVPTIPPNPPYDVSTANGIANGTVATIGGSTLETGQINFTHPTDFVTFNYVASSSTPSSFKVFAADSTLLGTFSIAGFADTHTFSSGPTKLISYMTFSGLGGTAAINQMQYDTAPVPEPESLALVAAGLLTVGALVRRRKA